MKLSKELIEKCNLTKSSIKGIESLVNFYVESLGWSEEEACKYALGLFKDGTIEEIKIIGGKENE